MTDLLVVLTSLTALVIIVGIGLAVYRREFNRRCGWCAGSGREWSRENAPFCDACNGTGRVPYLPEIRNSKLH